MHPRHGLRGIVAQANRETHHAPSRLAGKSAPILSEEMTLSPSRILAIGDIHGCARALDVLLAAVAPTPADLIITLGDYVDGGLDSAGVIDRLIKLPVTHRLVPLRGNHEEMMTDARRD